MPYFCSLFQLPTNIIFKTLISINSFLNESEDAIVLLKKLMGAICLVFDVGVNTFFALLVSHQLNMIKLTNFHNKITLTFGKGQN